MSRPGIGNAPKSRAGPSWPIQQIRGGLALRTGCPNREKAARVADVVRGAIYADDIPFGGQVEATADNENHDVNFVLILALQVIHPLRLIELRFDYAYIQHILFRCPSPRIASLCLKQLVTACCQAAF
jgi:hypothetical protein